MTDTVYLEPINLTRGVEATALCAAGLCAWLAGGPLAFAAVRVWQRQNNGGATTQVLSLAQARQRYPDQVAALCAAPAMPNGLASDHCHVMGILNVTPDSFSDGGQFNDHADAVSWAKAMAARGASVIDIGGESTRPGAAPVSIEEELARTIPVIQALRADGFAGVISLDTRNAAVMAAGLDAGADIINDVSALGHDPAALPLLAAHDCPIVLMHTQGTPQTMQNDPTYDVALLDVYDALAQSVARAISAGIDKGRLILDPGIGFGKTLDHNLQLMRGLGLFHGIGCSLLLGASRKRFIAGVDPAAADADDRLGGSLAAVGAAWQMGVQMVRVHDVSQSVQWLAVASAISDGLSSD